MKTGRILCLAALGFLALSCETTREAYKESGITQLVQVTNDKGFEFDPYWSKDGSKIWFASNRTGYLEIWVLPVKGGGIQQITSSSRSADRSPELSPDEKELVFQSTRVSGTWNIWKMSVGNRGLTQLTNHPNGAFSPRWSPDGTKIAYAANDRGGESYIWTMSPDGENPTQLGPGAELDWSPDGKRIVYSRKTSGDNYDIWVMNSDGSNSVQITSEKEKQESAPAWSRDGKRIAYVVKYDRGDYLNVSEGEISAGWVDLRSEIWTCDPDGRKKTQLTAFKGLNFLPAWAPDGRLAFVSNRGDSWDIWTMVPTTN
jgi:Tol biopolymer transport system component